MIECSTNQCLSSWLNFGSAGSIAGPIEPMIDLSLESSRSCAPICASIASLFIGASGPIFRITEFSCSKCCSAATNKAFNIGLSWSGVRPAHSAEWISLIASTKRLCSASSSWWPTAKISRHTMNGDVIKIVYSSSFVSTGP